MNRLLSILAVDDELPALTHVRSMLEASPLVGRVETAQSAGDALVRLSQERFDALFLDVLMPRVQGVEFARVLRRFASPPAVVFVSAHTSAAVDAFEVEALDYVLKPISRERIEKAVERVAAVVLGDDGVEPAEAPPAEPEDSDVIPVDGPGDGGTRLVRRASILYCEAQGDYVRIVSDDGRFLLRSPLSQIEERWEGHGFVRVHRGYVANMRRALEVRRQRNGTAVLTFPGDLEIPIARRRVGELRRRLRAAAS